jgi:hypothetical protein
MAAAAGDRASGPTDRRLKTLPSRAEGAQTDGFRWKVVDPPSLAADRRSCGRLKSEVAVTETPGSFPPAGQHIRRFQRLLGRVAQPR